MATLEDIAKVLGVSKGTVSKALNGAADVSETMRRSVLETAVELGYSRIRRGEEIPKLAIFITNMDYESPEDFGYDILVGFRKLAEPEGYQVDVIPLTYELEKQYRYDEYIMQSNYRGALFLGLSLDHPWLKEFKTCKTPTVLYDNRVSGNPRVSYVGADNLEGMKLAVAHLKELGHEKIGYISSAMGAYVYQQRYNAYFEAMKENGLPSDEALSGYSYFLEECVDEIFPRLRKAGCTAIICSHDVLANRLLIHCKENKIAVPEQLSVLGFDDLPLCRTTTPPMSTIRQNRTQLGKSAYCALASQMDNVPLSTFLLHTELVQRQSSGKAPETAVE